MQADLVHQLVHDECGSGHIAGVLHQGDEEVEYQYVRQEHQHASHTGNHAVHYQVLHPSVRHYGRYECPEFADQPVDPLHRIVAQCERRLENEIEYRDKYRERHPLVRHYSIYLVRKCLFGRYVQVRLVRLGERALDECVLGVHDGRLGVRMQQVFDSVLFFSPRCYDFIPVRKGLYDLLYILVVFQVLDCQIPRGVLVPQRMVLLKKKFYTVNALFEFGSMVDVDMSGEFRVALSIYLDDSVEKLRNTRSVSAYSRAYRHTQKIAQLFDVQLVTFRLQLIVHIQRHHHSEVHIDNLGGEVQIPFNVGCVHDIDDDIRHIVNQIFADIELLGAVGGKRVRSRQVHKHELVALIFERALFGIHGHSAVIAHVLVRA